MDMMVFDDMPVTLGELCEAIGEGRIEFDVRAGEYEVRRSEVRRLQRADEVVRRAVMHLEDDPWLSDTLAMR